jgi:hypothetical protein
MCIGDLKYGYTSLNFQKCTNFWGIPPWTPNRALTWTYWRPYGPFCFHIYLPPRYATELRENFLKEWYNQKDISSGKLDTFFSFKTLFRKDAYLELDEFELKKLISKFRI